jgi:hypothetical protein
MWESVMQRLRDLMEENDRLKQENQRLREAISQKDAEIAEWDDYERFVEAHDGPSKGAYVDAVGLGEWDDGKTKCSYCGERVVKVSGTPFIADAGSVICEECWNLTREAYIGANGEDIGTFKAVSEWSGD